MKKILILAFATFFLSCDTDNEKVETSNLRTPQSSKLDLGKFNQEINTNGFLIDSRVDNLELSLNLIENLDDSKVNVQNSKVTNDTFNLRLTASFIDKSDLNYLLDSSVMDDKLLGISTFSQINSEIKGIGFYYFSVNDNKFFLDLFSLDLQGNYEIIDGFPYQIDDIDIGDLLFLSNKYFPTHDIDLYAVSDYDLNYNLDNSLNDLTLNRAMSRLPYHLAGPDRDFDIYDGSISGPACSMAVHVCRNGSGPRCTATGCRPVPSCSMEELSNQVNSIDSVEFSSLGDGNLNQNLYDNTLVFSELYLFRDSLNNTTKGKRYTSIYYCINKHFKETLDLELTVEMILLSYHLDRLVTKSNDQGFNGVLVDQEIFDEISNAFLMSKSKSSSLTYQNAIDYLIQEFSRMKGMTKSQVLDYLNQPF